jgi:hypothetical protein
MKVQWLNREDTRTLQVFFSKEESKHERKKKVYDGKNQ